MQHLASQVWDEYWVLMAVFRTIFLMPIFAHDKVGLLWCKFKLESTIPHLRKWHQQWDITFFDNVELCELEIPSMIVHEDNNLLSTFGLLRVRKEKSWTCRMSLIPSPLLGCESTYLQNASTAFLDPMALVQPRSRIHTVGGAEFSVWKESPFPHASTGLVWNEKTQFFSDDSSGCSEPSHWDGLSSWEESPSFVSDSISGCPESPCVKKEVPSSSGWSPGWSGRSCSPGGSGLWRSPRRIRTSVLKIPNCPTCAGSYFLLSLLLSAQASRTFWPARRLRRVLCSSYVAFSSSTRAGSVSTQETKPCPELDATEFV